MDRLMTKNEIWSTTNPDNAWETIGLGGRYGLLSSSFISRENLIECVHFPPYSAYRHALDEKIRGIPEDSAACVSLRHDFYKEFCTTANNSSSVATIEEFFAKGNYYEAIAFNIQLYRDNPEEATGNKRQGTIHLIREGLIQGLKVHVRTGLITEAEREKLIHDFKLSQDVMAITSIVNSERRDAARYYINEDQNISPRSD